MLHCCRLCHGIMAVSSYGQSPIIANNCNPCKNVMDNGNYALYVNDDYGINDSTYSSNETVKEFNLNSSVLFKSNNNSNNSSFTEDGNVEKGIDNNSTNNEFSYLERVIAQEMNDMNSGYTKPITLIRTVVEELYDKITVMAGEIRFLKGEMQ